MTIRPVLLMTVIAAATLGSSGCFFKKAKAATPPATAPAPAPSATTPVQENATPAPVTAEPAPQPPQQATQPPVIQAQPLPSPTPPPRTSPRPRPVQSTPPPQPQQAPAPAPAPPAFGEIMSADQQARLIHACDQSSQAARRALNQASGHSLNRDQTDIANRVRSFLRQAEDSKSSDPSTAAQLAHRAELLANSLLSSLQ